jgi:hypothetical protein
MENLPCSWINRINIVKIAVPTKAMYMFNAIPTKISMAFFPEVEKSILRLIRKIQKTSNNKINSDQKVQCWRYHIS